jgi:selenocysteine lyase/cysteine desulfurase
MPVSQAWAYLDHAAVAPLTAAAGEAVRAWADHLVHAGATGASRWTAAIEQARRLGAGLIHADPDEVALVHNTTAGVSLVAEGFPFRQGDNVVTLGNEFPSNIYPWMNLAAKGVETRRVRVADGEVRLDALAAACDSRTRIVTVSWVGYASGWRIDLDEVAALAHSQGACLFVDAIQGLGVFPLDVGRTRVDFLAADGHKWLLGPEGAGLFYVRREHLARLRPLGVGWNSVVHSADFSRIELALKPAASRYEGGTSNTPGCVGLAASLQLICSYDPQAVADRVQYLVDLACAKLARIGAVIPPRGDRRHQSGILSFELPGTDPVAVRKHCLAAKVVLSCRAGRLRISPHAYNDESDLGRLIEVLRGAPRG